MNLYLWQNSILIGLYKLHAADAVWFSCIYETCTNAGVSKVHEYTTIYNREKRVMSLYGIHIVQLPWV